MTALATGRPVAVIGAGTMGAGIAQVAAAAGHPVLLFDASPRALHDARASIARALDGQVVRGRTTREDAEALMGRITATAAITDFAPAALVIEAVVEDLSVKRHLVGVVEATVSADAILATNTSSISITAIARDAQRPERIVGMHFFNPAPVMKLVEIVSGVATDPLVADTVFATAEAWGKIAVRARSTPGFIVNRVARPYYAEALRLLEEQVGDPATLDALYTGSAGFRMGPFALMDLIGHDVNYAVTHSVFEAYHHDPRFRPSIVQREMVDAGRLGRKSARGFFRYDKEEPAPEPSTPPTPDEATVPLADFELGRPTVAEGVGIVPTDGRRAMEVAREDGRPTIVYDWVGHPQTTRLAFAASTDAPVETVRRFVATLAARGIVAVPVADWPGLVVTRTVAMLANEAFETVLTGVADGADVDLAMRHGVNYPRGPIGWAEEIGLPRVLAILDHLHAATGDPRYRASMSLRMAVQDQR